MVRTLVILQISWKFTHNFLSYMFTVFSLCHIVSQLPSIWCVLRRLVAWSIYCDGGKTRTVQGCQTTKSVWLFVIFLKFDCISWYYDIILLHSDVDGIKFVVTSPAGAIAKYCDEYVCICVSVCLRWYLRNDTRCLPFLCMLPMAVALSSSVVVALRNVIPVLWMTSCFSSAMGRIAVWISLRRTDFA